MGPLPLTTSEQAFGRMLALLKFFSLFIVAVSVPAGIVFVFVSTGGENILSVPQRIAGHMVAAVCAGGCVFFALVNLQLILAALFGPRALLLSLPLGPRLLHLPTTGELRYAWFAIPLGIVFWMVCGVRVAMMMPIEPSANWVFKLTEPVDKRRMLSTVVTGMAAVTCVPIAALFAGAAVAIGELRLAGTVFLVVTLAGLCLVQLLTLTLKTVPFTCTYRPGQLRLRVYWAPFMFLWLQFTFTLANWSLWALQGTGPTLQLTAFLAAVWLALRVWHLARVRKINGFVYVEQPPGRITTMDFQAA